MDLTHERWRRQLKTFVDREASGGHAPAEIRRSIWTTLRNTAEGGVARGALEFFLKAESREPGYSGLPASLMVSLLPTPPGLAPAAGALAQTLAERRETASEITTIALHAGDTVRATTEKTLDFHVRMPGGAGYLLLAFSVPLMGTAGPMGNLCTAIAESLRWT
ncbi:hypothetical protein ABZ383_00875 [Streptomyces sp. NPDC005900]|uniref:hypothetical protein n=1 Tax=Streptomyces sp. NPDC005900 TaxID=3154569 RepID=UPI0033D597E6